MHAALGNREERETEEQEETEKNEREREWTFWNLKKKCIEAEKKKKDQRLAVLRGRRKV